LPRGPPAGVFQDEVGLTIRQELINHSAVRPAIWESGAKALPHQLSGVERLLVTFDTAHLCASSVDGLEADGSLAARPRPDGQESFA
jgi:hypothetical protein